MLNQPHPSDGWGSCPLRGKPRKGAIGGRRTTDAWEMALLFQQGATALASGFNAWHFAAYYSPFRRRRWGAMALVLVNVAFCVQALWLGVLPALAGERAVTAPQARFAAGWLPLAASALMTAFVLKRARRR